MLKEDEIMVKIGSGGNVYSFEYSIGYGEWRERMVLRMEMLEMLACIEL